MQITQLVPCFPFERIEHRQRLFAFQDVAGGRFPRYLRVAPDAEDIVDYLKGESQFMATLRIGILRRLVCSPQQGAQRHGD